MKLSIIIPVYNKEQWVRTCLESVLQNELKDWECILVNDCSTDNSLEILKEYVNKDPRFKLIDCPVNKGVSAARNAGLDVAQGEWISFLDADDGAYPDRWSYSIHYAEKNKLDICGCVTEVIRTNGTVTYWHRPKTNRDTIYLLPNIYNFLDLAGVGPIIYKRSLIGNVRFRLCNYGEDLIFNQELMPKYKKIGWCNHGYSIYNRRANELCVSPSKETMKQSLKCWREMIKDTHHPYATYLYRCLKLRRCWRDYNLDKL